MNNNNSAQEVLKTAHIHLESAMLRVHLQDADIFPLDIMNQESVKPHHVNWIGRSNDPTQSKQSLLVEVTDGYSLEEIANWVSHYEEHFKPPIK